MSFDLAKVDTPSRSQPQKTFREDTTMPRGTTDLPAKEINAVIRRPNDTGAAELARILGVGFEDAAQLYQQDQANRAKQDAGAAALDFSADHQDPEKFAKSRAYRNAWQLEGAKKLGVDIGAAATEKVNERLNDSDNPATPEEIDGIIEDVFKAHTTDPQGKLLDFGTPQAKVALANSMAEVRAGLIPQALAAIKKQTDAKFLTTWAYNAVNGYDRGGVAVGAHPDHPTDPLAPLADAQVPSVAVKPYYAPQAPKGLVEPFKGFSGATPRSLMGAPRQGGSKHNGEDFAVPDGTTLVAPMSGKVIASFSNARGGNQVRVQMADGAIVGMAHLSRRDVKVGDTVDAGQTLGLSGHSGDARGAHVHLTVEVDGKKVSPTHYFTHAKVPSGLPSGPPAVVFGDEPGLQPASAPATAGPQLPPFDFEKAMAAVPPGIAKGDAKAFLLQSLFNTANERRDSGLLKGLEDSHRADGTPSFTPTEIGKIEEARQQIDDRARVDADRARKDLWDKNHDVLLTAMIGPNPPSEGFIRQAAESGQIDPTLAFSLIREQEAEKKADAREARQEQRMADAQAEADTDEYVSGLVAERTVGHVVGAGPADDKQLLDSGKLGSGKRALARFQKLRAASHAGEQENLRNPDYAIYAGDLKQRYGTQPTNLIQKRLQGDVNYVAMITYYKRLVMGGTDPAEAYHSTLAKFAPKNSPTGDQARRARIAELQAKRAASGR